MTESRKSDVPHGVRLVSLLLAGGGAAGVVVVVLFAIQWFSQGGLVALLLSSPMLAAFGCSIWIGIELWRGRPWAYTWAKVLFIAQIPTISLPGLYYEFSTSLRFALTLQPLGYREATGLTFGFGWDFFFGPKIALAISHRIENIEFGLNLVAIAILIYLVKVTRARKSMLQATTVAT
jgi:hypothetical protein